jgi:hypothetical protein
MKCYLNPLVKVRRTTAARGSGWLVLCLVPALLSGCAGTHRGSAGTPAGLPADCQAGPPVNFNFSRDSFAFANDLVWSYSFDAQGRWTAHARDPKPDYSLHCFVLARSSEQFFKFARFDPQQPIADDATYRRLVKKVVSISPRKHLPPSEKIVVPGYADLKEFSTAYEKLLKEECGGVLQSYFQRGNWRMVFPFSRHEQEKMAKQLLASVRQDGIAVVHVLRFPSLSINHALLLFGATESNKEIAFSAYDPNNPAQPVALTFYRTNRSFVLPVTHYYPGGRVDVYQVYHRWNY